MKTTVKLKGNGQYNEWSDGDRGYIDGYIQGATGTPFAVVILQSNNSVALVPIYQLEAIGFIKDNI